MKHLVIGASGLVGSHLLIGLGPDGTTGTAFSRGNRDLLPLDIRDPLAVETLLGNHGPFTTVWILTNPPNLAWCEAQPLESRTLLAGGVSNVLCGLRAAGARDTRVVFFSTDYVFDGAAGRPYSEDDATGPLNTYGRHKLEAETLLAKDGRPFLVIRTTVVFGVNRLDPDRPDNHIQRIIGSLQHGRELACSTDQLSNPTEAGELTSFARRLDQDGATGIYHVVGRDPATRWEFACEVARAAGLSDREGLIRRSSIAKAGGRLRRPSDSRLATGKLRAALGGTPCGYAEGIADVVRRLGEIHAVKGPNP